MVRLCGFIVSLAALSLSPCYGATIPGRGLGARPPTPSERAYIESRYRETTEVRPNALARAREQAEVEAAPADGETAPELDGTPAAVDNSALQYFPPIRSQGSQGSCTAWASCYYWNTFEQALDHSYDVSGGNNDYIQSPGFMYPLMNDGYDDGAVTSLVMLKISDVGCSSWSLKPYSSSDWTSWPTEEAWVQALDNRTETAYYIDGSMVSGLNAIKQQLANGHLVVTDFDVYSTWYSDYPADATGIDNGVYYYPHGSLEGGHAVTIVGYADDKSYVDHRDSETHYGAFLLANSWGTSWGVQNSTGTGTNGFFWVAYDMFLEETFGPWAYYNDDRPDYRPKLYAVTGINHPERWDLWVWGGVDASPDWESQDVLTYSGGDWPIDDTKRVAVDLTEGILELGEPGVAFVKVYVWDGSWYDATMTSAHFFEDLDGDGTYNMYTSSDPTVTVAPGVTGYAAAVLEHEFSVTALTPSPATVVSGETTELSATYTDTCGHGISTWDWDDGGAGGSFAPSAHVQSPIYTAPTNLGDTDIIVTLTVSATCDGPEPLSDSDTTSLTVEPLVHELTVTAADPDPTAVLFGGSTSLSASYEDSYGHGVASWSWDDGGAGGSFSPSAEVQNPTYTAPPSGPGDELVVTLTVSAICDGPEPLGDSDSTILYVSSIAHTVTVTASAPDPATVGSGGMAILAASASDSMGHGIAVWSWQDGGAGGSFSPSASEQNPSYFAPINGSESDIIVTLTVTATCDCAVPVSDSDTTTLTVEPAAGARFSDIGATMNIPSANGGAWGDYDDDGDPDLFVGGMWGGHRCVLYRNNGDGTFSDVTHAVGLHTDSDSWEDWGAAWGDFNNDGRLDLIVMGGNHMPFLYRNDGDYFTDVGGEAAGFNPQWSVLRGVAWGDYDADGWLDVYTAIDYYGAPSRLYRNNHDETFTEVTETCGMEFAPVYYGQSSAWFDFDNDMLLDLIVARSEEATGAGSPARMYRNNGDGTFNDWAAVGDLQGADTCHGVAPGDYNNDGHIDLAFTPARNRPAWLFRNEGDGSFTDVSSSSGIDALDWESYGVAWGDYDNDGFLDLFMGFGGNGWRPFLFHSSGDGTFGEVAEAEGMTGHRKFRTACWADFDLDGDVDVFAGAAENYSCLYENRGPAHNWLRVRTLTDRDGDTQDSDPDEDRDALGARVEVNIENDDTFPTGTTLVRVIDGGSSFCGQNEQIAQFGVAGATTVAVRVTFIDGTVVTETDVAANRQIVVRDECQECGWIEGCVTDAWSAEPIAGATVEADGASTTTDALGGYVLGEVMPGSYTLDVSAPAYYPAAVADVGVTTGVGTVLDVPLTPEWGSIDGLVRDASNLLPLAGVTVTCGERSTETAGDGAYVLDEVRVGANQTVTASKLFYITGVATGIAVLDGSTTTVDFDLTAAGSIAGTVRDAATDDPIAGATVTCQDAVATTAGDGSYVLTGVPAGTGRVVTATATGYEAKSVLGVTVLLGETTTVDFLLEYLTGAIAGYVVDAATNLPIPGATVECDGDSTATEASGQYWFRDLRVGPGYTVTASAASHNPASETGIAVDAECAVVVNLELTATGTGAIAGTVTDADTGAEITGALVTCGSLSDETGSGGSYEISGVPADTATTVGVSAGGYRWASARGVEVSSGQTTIIDFDLALLSPDAEPAFEQLAVDGGWPSAVGAAWSDYDGDSYPDLFITGGGGVAGGLLVLRNDGDLTFSDVGSTLGVSPAGGPNDGVAWADYDNDGDLDAFVSGDGDVHDKLWRNDGSHFTDVAGAAGFTLVEPGRTVSWCDYDGDNWLDVFVCYVSYPGYDVKGQLYRNDGDGSFTNVSADVGMAGPAEPMYSFCSAWGDYDNDGWADLVVAIWWSAPMLYHNEGNGTFTEVGASANMTEPGGCRAVAWADYDNDGWLDCYVVANGGARDALFHNNADGTFTNLAGTAGMASDTFAANPASWADYDNDGYVDICVGGDNNDTVVLYHNNGDGTFTNAAAAEGLVAPHHSGAAVWADIDLDGRMDLFHGAQPTSVVSHNIGEGGNWLRVRALTDRDGDACDGDRSDDRDALGAVVELGVDDGSAFSPGRTLVRLIDGGSGFLGQSEPVAQFGVPTDGPVAVRVFFPDGSVVTHRDVGLNQQIVVRDVPADRLVESFSDVFLDFWAYAHTEGCVDAGIVAGYDDGLYHPDWEVTRAQMAVYISRGLAGGDENVPDPVQDPGFWDVTSDHWAYKYIAYAVDHEVVQGYPEGDYRPELVVDRGQMAVYVARAMAGGEDGVPDPPCTEPPFPDVPCDFWARKHVQYCVSAGVVQGYDDGLYRPALEVTRDQMAVYVARAFGL